MQKKSLLNLSGLDKFFLIVVLISLTIYIINYFSQARNIAIQEVIGIESASTLEVQIRSLMALIIMSLAVLYNIIYFPRIITGYILLFLFSLQCFFDTLTADVYNSVLTHVNHYTMMSLWIYVFIFFYAFFCRNRYLDISPIIIFYVLLYALLFFINYVILSSMGISWSYIESYFLITSLPLVLSLKKYRSRLISLIVFISVLAGKRTGIVALLLSLLLGLNIQKYLKVKNIKKLPKYIFISIMAIVLIRICLGEQIAELADRFINISEDGGSGRDIMYADVWGMIRSSDFPQLLLGHGYNSVIKDAPLEFSAHNDFLEILYDFGICGTLLYLGYVVSVTRLKYYSILSYPQKASILIFIIFSFFSHLILNTSYIIPLLLFWAYNYTESYRYDRI